MDSLFSLNRAKKEQFLASLSQKEAIRMIKKQLPFYKRFFYPIHYIGKGLKADTIQILYRESKNENIKILSLDIKNYC